MRLPSFPMRFRVLRRACALSACLVAGGVFGAATTPNPGLKYYYPAPGVPVVDVAADVIVYGGTSGGVVAAVQAARMGKSVALVVFGRHVGGMTSGGLSETDGVSSAVQGGITREYFNKTGNAGFKPSKAELEFENLLADPVPGAVWDGPVPTYFEQRLASVEKSGNRIVAIHMENGSVFRGRMFIDCSYEGDLMAGAGVSYIYGRESSAVYGETRAGKRSPLGIGAVNAYVESGNASSGLIYNLLDEPAGPGGSGDSHIQAYNFRMYTTQTSNASAKQPLFETASYDAGRFELLYRFHRAGGSTTMGVGNDINNHEIFAGLVSTDHIGGNRWPDGAGGWIPWPEADNATRELIYQSHVAWQLGMLWYMKTDARYRALATDPAVSDTIRTNLQALLAKVDQLGLAAGEYPETGGWPHELYVREARRMIADYVVTQAHYDRAVVVEDPVGLANYLADSHHVRRLASSSGNVILEGGTSGTTAPAWRIPYRSIVPKRAECTNLLVPWSISASHVAFCSMRMEPCFMVLSQSAATAASLAIDRAEAVQDLPYALLKLHLMADGQILGADPLPETGIIVDNTEVAAVTLVGNWTASSATAGYYGSDYLLDGNATAGGSSVTFTPTLPQADTYQVFLRWTAHANRASVVPVDVLHANGTATLTVNQQSNGGIWFLLGNYAFAAGDAGSVRVRNDGAAGYVIADAVKFLALAPPDPANGAVHVLAPDPVADEETGAPGRFQFVRTTADIASAVAVSFLLGGTAVSGQDYVALPGSVTIPANARSANLTVVPVPDAVARGTRALTLTLEPDPAYAVGDPSGASVSIYDRRYDGWRFRHFAALGQENGPESAGPADPDHDGLSNRIEFVLGSDPRAGTDAGHVKFRLEGDLALLEFPQTGEASANPVLVEYSENLGLGTWVALDDPPVTVSYDPWSGDRVLRASRPWAASPGGFFRLRVP